MAFIPPSLYYVWFTTYGTYDDVDVPSKPVSGPHSFEKAASEIARLGFGYCIKDHP